MKTFNEILDSLRPRTAPRSPARGWPDRRNTLTQPARGVSLCGAAAITIDGQTFTPNEDVAYVEFHLAHAFPVTTQFGTGIHPQVVANSYRTLVNKVFNFAHLLRAYDPERNPQDHILGTVMAVEFPETPAGGWTVQADRAAAPGIRAVAVMHKAAQWVSKILATWSEGRTPFGPGEWTVSMENTHNLEASGFLVHDLGHTHPDSLQPFVEATPADLAALGYVYVPCAAAPEDLLSCLNAEGDTRIVHSYQRKFPTLLLLNGLDGALRFQGVGLCPVGMEPEARVATMLAAEPGFNLDRIPAAFDFLRP